MTGARAALRAIVACFTVAIASSVSARCPAGTRVYSLTVWSGHWLDGLVIRCTGDSDEQIIPPDFNDTPGGAEAEEICAGTAGVQSLYWDLPQDSSVFVNFDITCLNNQTHRFANTSQYINDWVINGSRAVSCEEGQYVQGISYSLYYPENYTTYKCYLTDLEFMCSSATLDPICTDCSGDTTLLPEENQPEYCETTTCSEAECCESNGDEEAESFTSDIMIGVISTVVAAVIVSGSAWTFRKFKNKPLNGKGVTGFDVEDKPSGTPHTVDSP